MDLSLIHILIPGRFVSRPNRFLAQVKTADGVQTCHVKNTGRCACLLYTSCDLVPQDVTGIYDETTESNVFILQTLLDLPLTGE